MKLLIALLALLCMGNTAAQLRALGEQGEYEEAAEIAREAADDGDPAALEWLGWAYEYAKGVPADLDQAASYYRQASAAGEIYSSWRLGVLIDEGKAEGSLEEAVALFRQGADANHLSSIVSLAVMQATGRGTPNDQSAALQNYMAAAALGSPHAARGVGVMLWRGEGVEVDRTEAAAWFMVSVIMGSEEGEDNLGASLDELERLGQLDYEKISERANEIIARLGLEIRDDSDSQGQ